MKKRYLIIAIIILILLVAIVTIFMIRRSRRELRTTELFQDSDYPISFETKEGKVIVKLNGSKSPDLMWEAEIEDEEYVKVEAEGKERKGKAQFIISPLKVGSTRVNFVRRQEAAGHQVDVSLISLPVYSFEVKGTMAVDVLENPNIENDTMVIGAETEHPIVLCGKSEFYQNVDLYRSVMMDASGTDAKAEDVQNLILGNIDFLNGKGDWTIDSDNFSYKEDNIGDRIFCELFYSNGRVAQETTESSGDSDEDISNDDFDEAVAEDSNASTESIPADYSSVTDSEAVTGETSITFSSNSLGITKKVNVTVYADNHMTFSDSEEKK